MNDPMLVLRKIQSVVRAASDAEPHHQFGAFAAVRVLIDDLRQHAKEEELGGYTLEKLTSLNWHMAAMLGFDADNGHLPNQHLVWAIEALHALEGPLCFGRTDPE